MKKLLLLFVVLVLVGAGCEVMVDESGCPLEGQGIAQSSIERCHAEVRCKEEDGFIMYTKGYYAGCTFNNGL